MFSSLSASDRLMVANVLEREMMPPHGLDLLKKLLADKDENIVLKAASAACKQKQLGVADTIIKAYVKYPRHKNAIIQAMSLYGDDFFKDSIYTHNAQYPELTHFFIDIATKTGGPNALEFLLNAFDTEGVDNGKLIHVFYEGRIGYNFISIPETKTLRYFSIMNCFGIKLSF